MKLMKFNEISSEKWDNFVLNNSMEYVYHLYDFVEFDWYEENKNISFAITDDNEEIVFIEMLYIRFKKQSLLNRLIHSKKRVFLSSRWGYVLKDGLSEKTISSIKQIHREYIQKETSAYKLKSYEIALPPLSEYTCPEHCPLVNPVIFLGFKPTLRYTYIIDLRRGYNSAYSGYSATTRNEVNKTRKNRKIYIRETMGDEVDFHLLKKLHLECYNRTHGKVLSGNFLKMIFEKTKQKKYCRMFFAEENEKVKATIILITYNKTAYYWWGFSGNDTDSSLNKYFMDSLIQKLLTEGYEWFEVGRALPWLNSGKMKTISEYKRSFSKLMHPIYSGEYSND